MFVVVFLNVEKILRRVIRLAVPVKNVCLYLAYRFSDGCVVAFSGTFADRRFKIGRGERVDPPLRFKGAESVVELFCDFHNTSVLIGLIIINAYRIIFMVKRFDL